MRKSKAASASLPKPPGSNRSTGDGFESAFENNFIDNKTQSQLQMQDEVNLQALEEQERTIRELEDNIVGVNEIYKKLGALVYEQGNTIDSIEASVENTGVFVQEGTEQLRRASHYSVSERKFQIKQLKSYCTILDSSSKEKDYLGSDTRSHSGYYSAHLLLGSLNVNGVIVKANGDDWISSTTHF